MTRQCTVFILNGVKSPSPMGDSADHRTIVLNFLWRMSQVINPLHKKFTHTDTLSACHFSGCTDPRLRSACKSLTLMAQTCSRVAVAEKITWLMGLLTKAPTFRAKMVSRTSRGEARPSLLFDTVSVSSLEKTGNVGTHSQTTAEPINPPSCGAAA